MKVWNKLSLVHRILIGLIIGVILSLTLKESVSFIAVFGNLFVGALRAVAPILVFFLVMSAISQKKEGTKTNMKDVIILYLFGTFAAAVMGVISSFLFPVTLTLERASSVDIAPPGAITDVFINLLMDLVENPVSALVSENYLGILSWAVLIGLALGKLESPTARQTVADFSDAISATVLLVISFAPIGIMGLVYNSIMTSGLEAFLGYGKLLIVLVGTMLAVALVLNPLIVFFTIRQNPYPLTLKCLRESGVTAFFTRSSAANIPVNMSLCERLGLNKDMCSVAIPLGATINMAGAAVTISVLSLAAANTLGIKVDFGSAVILSLLAAVSACGASGVAGGSLLLIPLACSLFKIPGDISIQVVGVGFIIGVIQDSCETALNSSTDVLFAAAAEFKHYRKEGKPIVINK